MRQRVVSIFLSVVLAIGIPALIAVQLTGHLELHARINRWHAGWADIVFAYGTHLADGLVPLAIGLVFLFVRWRWFLLLAVSVLGSSIIIQLLKHALFADIGRPGSFAWPEGLRLVPGVEQLYHNSFPSGHSTCAFSMCMVLAIIVGRTSASIGFAVLACLLGFSRVYLSQHFTEDVLCGACIGTITAWAAYRWLFTSAFARRAWLDRSLLRR